MRLGGYVWLALLVGCPRAIVTADLGGDLDAGDGGPADADGAGPADADGPTDRGDLEDGARDGGAPDDAAPDASVGPPPIVFRQLGYPSTGSTVNAVFARSRTEVYVGNANGVVMRFDGQSFVEIWREPNNFAVHRLGGTATRLFIGGASTLYLQNASGTTTERTLPAGGTINDLHVLADAEAYVVADDPTGRRLLRYDGATLAELHAGFDSASFASVHRDEAGTVWVGGLGRLFSHRDASFGEEALTWPAELLPAHRPQVELAAFGRAGDRLFLGASHQIVFERRGERFEPVFVGGAAEATIRGIAGAAGEAYAVGAPGARGSILRFDGAAWTETDQGARFSLWQIVRLEAEDVYFAVGAERNTNRGVVLVGAR